MTDKNSSTFNKGKNFKNNYTNDDYYKQNYQKNTYNNYKPNTYRNNQDNKKNNSHVDLFDLALNGNVSGNVNANTNFQKTPKNSNNNVKFKSQNSSNNSVNEIKEEEKVSTQKELINNNIIQINLQEKSIITSTVPVQMNKKDQDEIDNVSGDNTVDENMLDSTSNTKNNLTNESMVSQSDRRISHEDIKFLVEELKKNKDVIRKSSEKLNDLVIEKSCEINNIVVKSSSENEK
jgi:hypothetical protein